VLERNRSRGGARSCNACEVATLKRSSLATRGVAVARWRIDIARWRIDIQLRHDTTPSNATNLPTASHFSPPAKFWPRQAPVTTVERTKHSRPHRYNNPDM
ncbi:unnamed protein product, partial [Ectocarpus sp. 8 AP-2014]